MQEDSKFLNGFVGSVLVHVAIAILMLLLPKPKAVEAPLVFDVVQAPSVSAHKAQQVIRTLDNPDLKPEQSPEEKLRFLSEKTQRVKQQMRALESGLTKNRSSDPSQATPNPKQAETPKTVESKSLDTNGLERFLPPKMTLNSKRQARNFQEKGFSTLSEDIPSDIKVGEITAVDTEHYLFYSYFARAQELLWNEWAPMVQSVVNRPPPAMRSSTQTRFSTILEAWFLPSGQLHSVHLLKPSGVPELDYVATTSFKRVGMIPNPPREKIDPDGLVRFKWSLTVEYDPKVLVRQ